MDKIKYYHFEHSFFNTVTGVQHTMLLENNKTFHSQNRDRFDWSFRAEIEALASQRVYWCTLTYEPENAVKSYKEAVKHDAGNINKYIPTQYKQEYNKYMRMTDAARNEYAHNRSFNPLHCEKRFKYFCARRGWLPPVGAKLHNTSTCLEPLWRLDQYYYYSQSEHTDMLNHRYMTRTQAKYNFDHIDELTFCELYNNQMPGFDQFEDGFQYTENQFNELYLKKKKAFLNSYPAYKWTSSDDTLLCKEHISSFVRSMQRQFKALTGSRFRFMYNGEYGSSHHRSHYHLLIYIPESVNLKNVAPQFFHKFIASWKYGKIKDCKDLNLRDKTNIRKVVNYVGKHFMKYDVGNFWQQAMSPIFRQTSCYDGGIGYQLFDPGSRAYSSELLSQYVAFAGERSPVLQVNGFTHIAPRYYRRMLFPDFKFNDDQLTECAYNKLVTLYSRVFNDFSFIPSKKFEKKSEIIKDLHNFVKSKPLTLQWSQILSRNNKIHRLKTGRVLVDASDPNVINQAIVDLDCELLQLDFEKRKAAFLKYKENKNKLRRACDRIEFDPYVG